MSIPEQPFGFVAGRWVLSLADTPMDSDRAPDYKPLYPGSVVFNNKLSHRVVTDGSETVGIVKTRIEAKLNEDGKLIDAEEHEFIALPVGVYSVTFSFGQYSWPNFDIEVKPEHTVDSPLWLPSKSPIPAGPGIVHVVSEEARLAAEAAAASAWEAVDTPGRRGPQGLQGIQGLSGEIAGTVRVVNLMDSRNYQLTGYAQSTPTRVELIRGHKYYARKTYDGPAHPVSGSIRVLSNPNHVFVGSGVSSAVTTYSGAEETDLTVYVYGVGGETYNMTDVVLVDLTETFGSGNEPGLVYMDNIVRREDGWFDTSSPIVGNAYSENVVIGQGETLRVDNSFGTQVLLDHPGGTTMLWSDTGWHILTSWDETGTVTGQALPNGITPTGGQSGSIQIRRQNNSVTVTMVGYTLTGSASIQIPTGFRVGNPENYVYGTFVPIQGEVRPFMASSSTLILSGAGGTYPIVGNPTYRAAMTYISDQDWPTTV